MSMASSRAPPSAQPTKFNSPRTPSRRTSGGMSSHREEATNCASRSVTCDCSPLICAPSDRQIAAVHGNRAASDPARLVGGEKQHGTDQIVGLAEPSERDQCLGCA